MLSSTDDRFQDIRDAIRDLCAQFPDEYHREAWAWPRPA
jgi:acyl-CoA dehydrogenase